MGVTRKDTRSLDDNSNDFLLYHKQVKVTRAHEVLIIYTTIHSNGLGFRAFGLGTCNYLVPQDSGSEFI